MNTAVSVLRKTENTDGIILRNPPRISEGVVRTPVEGRSCGTCTMCCKLYPVPVMDKPPHVWCRECKPGKGCGIWDTRPQFCRDFHCHYILDAEVGEDWRPDICKFIMNFQSANIMWIKVDPAHKTAWKREPYYGVIKRWSKDFIDAGGYILIDDGLSAYCVTPSDDVMVSTHGQPVDFHVRTTKVGLTTVYDVVMRKLA
jgi:hypothetical protein